MNSDQDSLWEEFGVPGAFGSSNPSHLLASYTKSLEIFRKVGDKELEAKGWLAPKLSLDPVKTLFGHLYREDSKALFRRSAENPPPADLLWISAAIELSERLVSDDLATFKGMDRATLREFAQLSVEPESLSQVQGILRARGVVVVYLRGLSGQKTDGMVFTLPKGNPAIAMSIRYPRLDYFWFTLMHELAHIVLHYDRLGTPIIDELDQIDDTAIEIQADRLAKDSLVPRNLWRNAAPKYSRNIQTLIEFSKKVNVHPAVVAGLMRREENNYEIFSKIVNSIDTRKFLFEP